MTVSLYRKYRPQDFGSVVGQKAAVEVLTRSIEKGRIGHAYLFSGSRGCGKTSVARIFAKALNCTDRQGYEPCGKCSNCEAVTAGESLDVIEIDGASNNGVDEVRQLKENIALAPFSSKYKIYIIDEVHMLSTAAFNALLKTLEEPPEHAIFIMATTEPRKVPVTIRSRCQHIPFHSITPEDIFARLKYVCEAENVTAEPEALYEIARQADGALRDALSLLEQVIASGEITLANVEAVFGAGSRPAFERWLRTLREDSEDAYTGLKAMFDAGASGVRVFEEMFSLVRNLWLASKWKGITESLGLSEAERKFLAEEVNHWKPDRIYMLLTSIMTALTKARQGVRPDILLGMFMLSLEAPPPVQSYAPLQAAPAVQPQPVQPPAPMPVTYDDVLKSELITAAHEGSFTIYCLMFSVKAGRTPEGIVIEAEHPYIFDRLKLPAHKSALADMFGSYGTVKIAFMGTEEVCEKLGNALADNLAEEASTVPPQPPSPEPEEASPAQVSPSVRQGRLTFEVYRNELAMMGASPEIIFIRRKEKDETESAEDSTLQGDDEE
ncbi:MAG: DNA polymerase III subunit gamma/tau [Synergistaceae bacterium]|nr:DNA polymerase III subunit gamma/tau [Synergistaceae bacterium]